MSITMIFGLATEAWSRPAKREDDGYRGWVGDPVRTKELLDIVEKKRDFLAFGHVPPEVRLFFKDPPTVDDPRTTIPMALTDVERKILKTYSQDYMRNYLFRMIPHFIGFVPYVTVWVVYFTHFFTQMNDLRIADEPLFDKIPDFVPWIVAGTFVLFSTFTVVQWRYRT